MDDFPRPINAFLMNWYEISVATNDRIRRMKSFFLDISASFNQTANGRYVFLGDHSVVDVLGDGRFEVKSGRLYPLASQRYGPIVHGSGIQNLTFVIHEDELRCGTGRRLFHQFELSILEYRNVKSKGIHVMTDFLLRIQ